MTGAWVIDSSVGFAWIHPGQATAATDRLLDEAAMGTVIVVPVLWFAEIANGLLVLQRRKKLTSGERESALAALSKLPFTIDEQSARAAFGETSKIAERYGLTVYDAIYLELALRRKLPLASRDQALNGAATKAGIQVL